jgi:RNA polymerase sigma factor (sigma-70 family)
MAGDHPHRLTNYLRNLVAGTQAREASDRELMEQFVADRDGAALTALVRRHGPMVYNLCRRVLRNEQDAEDAFQATFMVLARKAHTLRSQEGVGNWLYGVAYRTALKARTAAAARRSRQEAAAPVRDVAGPLAELTVHEAQTIVDQELARLPDKYRAPLVLCCLEGLTRDEAAQQLGWSPGLLKSRLEQARELLRNRLVRRGMTLTAGLFSAGLLGSTARAGLAPALVETTVRAAVLVASGGTAGTVVSAQVVALSEGVLKAMWLTKFKVFAAVCLVLVPAVLGVSGALIYLRAAEKPDQLALAPAPADPKPKEPPAAEPALRQESLERWGWAEVLFTARLVKAEAGPVTNSDPPVYSHKLHFQVGKVLRGSLKKGEQVTASSSIRQPQEPVFPVGKDCLMAGKNVRGQLVVVAVEEAKAETLAQAERACAVPVGWSVDEGLLASPWAKLGKAAWAGEPAAKGSLACAATGRPALLVGGGVEFTAEPVPPKVAVKFANPDGDGEYQVTVKNGTDKPVTVPALLSDGKAPLWDESLVILCQGKSYMVPGAKGVGKAARPTVLKPGESVSGVVNVLKLQGPEWPRGGYRIEFQFCLGEKSVTKSFYYTSRHHDPLREKANEKPAPAEEKKETAHVEGTVVIPKEVASFEGRVLEVRLYKHDPRLADQPADLVEKVEVKDFAHTQGKETTREFVIGAKDNLEPKLGYYVTLFILEQGQRTHIGECADGKGPCNVLTQGQPNKISLTVREVKK